MKRVQKLTRTDKEKINNIKPIKKTIKQEWVESYGLNKITLTSNQQTFANKIIENDLVFCVGPAGTGKTLATLYTYVKEYLQDNTKKIIFIKTPVEAGMDKIGALPDSYSAKIEPHFAYAKYLLTQLLSVGKVETDLDHRIFFKIPNFCLGETFDNSLICIDEAQQLPPLILKLLLERTGINSKVVVLGDNTQLYTSSTNRNALRDAIPRFFSFGYDHTQIEYYKYPGVSYHEYLVDDVMRSDLVKTVIKAYS